MVNGHGHLPSSSMDMGHGKPTTGDLGFKTESLILGFKFDILECHNDVT